MTIRAVYEDGVFRPLQPVAGLQDRQEVSITLESRLQAKTTPPLITDPAERQRILESFAGSLSDEEAEKMIRDIEEEFERLEEDE